MMPLRFPPVFADSPLAYAFALFSLTLASALSLAMLVGFVLEVRRAREIEHLVASRAPQPGRPGYLTLLDLHRLIVSGFLLTILLGATPDVVVLLAWGEASDGAMFALFQLDRIFDGLTILPLATSLALSTIAAQSVDHRLFIEPAPVRLSFKWSSLRDKFKIGGVVLCIAIGVTLSKAGLQ